MTYKSVYKNNLLRLVLHCHMAIQIWKMPTLKVIIANYLHSNAKHDITQQTEPVIPIGPRIYAA